LQAFKTFFANMPTDSGMAFVLVQHLDPNHKSMLVDLLGAQTAMPVVEAKNRMAVAADRIFVIPPNSTMTIARGILHVSKPAPKLGQ
jgi:two-component system CheB/CheR fusion protein